MRLRILIRGAGWVVDLPFKGAAAEIIVTKWRVLSFQTGVGFRMQY